MYNYNNSTINEGDMISMDNRRNYTYNALDPTKGKIGTYKGYDIQVVDIRPGDTLLFHLNDDVDIETVAAIMEEMSKTFPKNTIIPVNEWILKGMTILRKAEPVDDCVSELTMIQPLEELYPELFDLGRGTAVKPGEIIW